MGLEVSIWAAFAAGIISFLSPCVLPLVPPYLCFITGTSLEDLTAHRNQREVSTAHVLASSVCFVLGFSTVFIALGATASAVGEALRDALSWSFSVAGHEFNVLASVAGVIIIVMGLHFLGVFRLAAISKEVRYHHASRPAGYVGAYAIGLAFALGWTPCIGPVLAAILAIAGSEQSALKGAGLLAVYSAGLGLPFIAAAMGVDGFLLFSKNIRRHLTTIERVMGGLLVVTGIAFLSGAMQTLSYWLIEAFPTLAQLG